MKRLVLLLALLSLPAYAQAVDRYVKTSCTNAISTYNPAADTCTGGSSLVYSTIANGISALASGETLYIRGGTYSVTISDSQFAGKSGSSYAAATKIRAYQTEVVTINNISFAGAAGVNTSYVIFEADPTAHNFRVQNINVGQAGNTGLAQFIKFDGLEVTGTTVIPTEAVILGEAAASDIWFTHMKVSAVSHTCNSGGPGPMGFYVQAPRVTIENSEIFNLAGSGIQNYDQVGGRASNNIFRNNYIHDTGRSQPGACPQAAFGITLFTGTGHAVYNNVIANSMNGIDVNASNSNINSNTFYANTDSGSTCCYPALKHNSGSGNTFRNNLLVGNSINNFDRSGASSVTSSNNMCSGGCELSVTQTAAQIFVGASVGNFRLQSGSEAIGKGFPLGSPYNTDFLNNVRASPFDLGAYEYTITPPPVNQLVLALPLDEGSGTIATDVSGQKNNANLASGATWDNSGKYGKAIAFDGTGYLTVPAASTLALAPSMTLEAWVYPTIAASGFSAILSHDRYFLYAATDASYCPSPALAPLGGYHTTVDSYICATSLPPINQWSYLAVTHDGTTLTFYLNGAVVASQLATDPMAQASYPVTIAASDFGENFVGKIDEPRIYNYARTPAQIVSDMNTPLIGGPGKYVDIAAPASVEISASSSIEIGAD